MNWDLVIWPVNMFVLLAFIVFLLLLYRLRRKSTLCNSITTIKTVVPAIIAALLVTIVMGLTRQTKEEAATDFLGLSNMLTFWPFILCWLWVDIILAETILYSLFHFNKKKLTALLSHIGLFLILTCGVLGSSDIKRYKMYCLNGIPECQALDKNNRVVMMPFYIKLNKFTVEEYSDTFHSTKQYISNITIQTREHNSVNSLIYVNKPYYIDGWKIYQYAYEDLQGNQNSVSILELIYDPWQPLVYIGIGLLFLGALIKLFSIRKTAIAFAVIYSFASWLFMQIKQQQPLMPALQSIWFAPHVVAYMIAYSLMAVAFIIALYVVIFNRKDRGGWKIKKLLLIDNCILLGYTFLTTGMLMGAIWAKDAWGHYWNWDPKETWALITWLSYLTYIHYRKKIHHNTNFALMMVLFSFILLQFCWWGINYLPSAQGISIHTYDV